MVTGSSSVFVQYFFQFFFCFYIINVIYWKHQVTLGKIIALSIRMSTMHWMLTMILKSKNDKTKKNRKKIMNKDWARTSDHAIACPVLFHLSHWELLDKGESIMLINQPQKFNPLYELPRYYIRSVFLRILVSIMIMIVVRIVNTLKAGIMSPAIIVSSGWPLSSN